MRFVGVDPGFKGAIALLNHDARRVATWPMPVKIVKTGGRDRQEIDDLALCRLVESILNDYEDRTVVTIEQVYASPQMGVTSAFRFGGAYKAVTAVFAFFTMADETLVQVRNVTPAVWKRAMGVNADKTVCRTAATRLWPRSAKDFYRVGDDGRAEAALIAEWGRLKYERKPERNR